MNARPMLSLLATLVTVMSLAAAQPAFAAEFQVNSTSACTLADAIRSANKNESVGGCSAGSDIDVIKVTGDITLNAELPTIRSKMTIISDDLASKRIISGDYQYRIFNVDRGASVTLRALQLINGRKWGQRGGALRMLAGRVGLIDVRMENNWAELGGGALRAGNRGTVTCHRCAFVDNQSTDGGAIWVGDYGNITLADSVVYNNSADRGGGMFIIYGHATLAGTSFSNNHADEGPDLLAIEAEVVVQP